MGTVGKYRRGRNPTVDPTNEEPSHSRSRSSAQTARDPPWPDARAAAAGHRARPRSEGLRSGAHFTHKQMMIEAILRATGTYWWGRANARKVQLRRNDVRLPRLPKAFDGFTILHLSDLHADMSAPALDRVAQLAVGLEYDLCVLTGDYRGRTYGDYKPCLEGVAH